jgi:Tfp pilus assembly protein PilF
MQVESVSFITSTMNPAFFFLGTAAFYLSLKDKISAIRILAISSLLFLSFLTKETGFLFLIIIFIYQLIFNRSNLLPIFISGVVSSLTYFLIRFGIGGVYFTKVPDVPIAMLPLEERILSIPKIFFYYNKTFFFPKDLAINQQWIVTEINISDYYLPLLATAVFFALLIGIGIYIYKFKELLFKKYLFFSLWFLTGIILLLQIVPIDMTVADRWFYFPIAGLLGVIGVCLHASNLKIKRLIPAGILFLSITIVLLSLRTIVRNSNWRDGLTLYTHDTKIHTNAENESNLGLEYAYLQKYNEAIPYLEKSVELFPREESYFNLAYTHELKGEVENAKENYFKALNSKHYLLISQRHMLNTYVRLGRLLLLSGSPEAAEQVINTGLEDYPDSGTLWALLAVSGTKMQNYDSAITAAEKAKEIFPSQFTQEIYDQVINKQPINLEKYLQK